VTPAQPIIEAGPYTLRRPDPTDIPWIFTACQDPELGRWTQIPRPYRPEDAVAFVENRMREVWPFVITRTESGELLGAIALKSFDPQSGCGEIGYWLAAEARGHGTMSTALAALETATTVHLGAREMILRIADGNAASLAVAQRAGYAPAGREPASCNGLDALVFKKRLAPPAT
jgi:RimJ/RimL family protein N-acetyltransferase